MRRIIVSCLIVLLLFPALALSQPVKVGAQVLLEKHLDMLRGKRVGIICNHTSVFPDGVHIVDTLLRSGIEVTALFGPEHGIRGRAAAGVSVASQTDPLTGIPMYSLYGKTLRPTPEMLFDVDLLLFDLQDVGARFYTYGSTMANAMESARDFGKKFIVLDRPNPINGESLEGPVLDMEFVSFLGMFPLPIRHGLTLGELAKMIVGEGWLNFDSNVDLTVIPMEGWKRSDWYDASGLPWISPSPNMRTMETATVYPGTCLVEATNISEGRGTDRPFEYIGAPGLKSDQLAQRLNTLSLPGVRFEPITFTPKPDSVAAPDPKFKNKECHGVLVKVTDRTTFKPVLTGLMLIGTIKDLHPKKFQLKRGLFDRLAGDPLISEKLLQGNIRPNILNGFAPNIEQFRQRRAPYLLYE